MILLRGWFGVFSTGLDAIADALKAKGIRAQVAGHLQWKIAADEIRRERAGGKTDAIVLVGHSQGANNVIDMARVLEAQNVPVALLVTLAPYRQDPVPANVVRAINYYQSAGWGAPLTGIAYAAAAATLNANWRGFADRPREANLTYRWTVLGRGRVITRPTSAGPARVAVHSRRQLFAPQAIQWSVSTQGSVSCIISPRLYLAALSPRDLLAVLHSCLPLRRLRRCPRRTRLP